MYCRYCGAQIADDSAFWAKTPGPNGKLAGDVINTRYHQARISRPDLSYANYIAMTWTLAALATIAVIAGRKKQQTSKGGRHV